ncbi:trypsin-like peptidase domain-containing protein [Streptomyces sp. NPDC048417]|uniref:nSTAND1 domain-containing NTPase n=1 Tax=Streptomyces sp. NPDC048417 TaxID=3155387 RepID=UPI00343FB380
MNAPESGWVSRRARELRTAVAQIIGRSGQVTGAGFLVAEDLLVTCAHVVLAAGPGPGGTVQLVFPQVEGAPRVRGRVVGESWRSPDGDDVAVVRLTGTPPGVTALPLGSAEGCRGHQVRSFGFPAQAPPGGHFGFGVCGDLLRATGSRGLCLQLTAANDLTTGFSGAPVLDEVTGLVIGMLTEITSPDVYARGQGIAYVTPEQVLREIRPELTEEELFPYRGLEPFHAEHARWFHGRAEAVRQVLAGLARQRRLTILLGPSGSGKTSLIHAGVLPALASGELPGSDSWLPLLVRPRQDLAAEWVRAGLSEAGTDGLSGAVARALAAHPTAQRLLLVVDQFEELLTQSSVGAPDGRQGVTSQITEALEANHRLNVLLVMRDDFYPRLAAVAPQLLEAAMPGLLNVPAVLSKHELHDMATLPAREAGAHFDPGLPGLIVTDVLTTSPEGTAAGQATATVLPLVEVALSQLWLRRHEGFLTHEAYQRIGGVTGSLATWADTALDRLPPRQRPIAQRILTSLVRPADPVHHIPAVRAQVPLRELRDLATDPNRDPENDGDFDEVLAALTAHRIVTTHAPDTSQDADTTSAHPVAELIHDALIRDWGTLHEWVRQDHRFQGWLEHARAARARWDETSDPGDLLTGTALAEGLEWAQQRHLPGEITAYLTVSRQRQQEVIRRSRRLNAVLACVLALVLIAAGGAAWQWRRARAEQQADLSRQIAVKSGQLIQSNPDLASLLAVQAYRTSHTPEASASLQDAAALPLHRTLTGHEREVYSVAYSPDGRTLATGSTDGTARLWDSRTGRTRTVLRGHSDAVWSVAFSPDGRTIATGSTDRTARLWDVTTGRLRRVLSGHTDGLNSVAFAPDGRTLATGANDDTARLWDTATGKPGAILRGHTDWVYSVAFSPDGRTLATASKDDTARLWDVTTHQASVVLRGHTAPVWPAKFSPDGRLLATGSADQTARLWDVATHTTRLTLSGHSAEAWALAFSPDGHTLATGSADQTARLWDVATGANRAVLAGHTNAVEAVAFSPDGHTLATGSDDKTARLWNLLSGRARKTITGHTATVRAAAFSPDGRLLATGSDDQTVRLWDVASGRARGTLARNAGSFSSLAFNPDGRIVAGGSDDQTVRMWDVPSGRIRSTLPGQAGAVDSVAFSPDGRTLATGTDNNTAQLWDVATHKVRVSIPVTQGAGFRVNGVAFSRDGHSLATALGNNAVQMWDVATGRPGATFTGHTNAVDAVAFSPDGRTVATASEDLTARLWDIAATRTRTTLTGHTGPVRSVAFSPDGRTLATGGDEGAVRLWDAGTGQVRATLTGHTGPVWSVVFSPDGRILASVGSDRTVRLWDTGLPELGEAVHTVCGNVGRDLSQDEREGFLPGRRVGRVCP